MDLKQELIKIEREARAAIAAVEHNNLGMALNMLVGVVDGLEKLQKEVETDVT